MKNLIQQIKLLETINQKNVKDKKFLLEKEKKEFMHSIDAVKALWEAASKIDPDLSK